MAWYRKIDATTEPISLAEAKEYLRVEHNVDDALISNLITASRHYIEQSGGLALAPQTIVETRSAFPASNEPITLTVRPLRAVPAITYYDSTGVLQTLDSADVSFSLYTLDAKISMLDAAQWPETQVRADAVLIEYEAGFNITPFELKQAMQLLIAEWYERREVRAEEKITSVMRIINRFKHLIADA